MKKQLFILALLVCIVATACKTQCPPLSDSQKADIKAQILGLWEKITISIEKLDIEGYSSFISSDEFIAMYVEARPYNSKTEITDTLRVWFSKRKSNVLEQKTVNVTVLTENLVLLDQVCNFQVNLKDDSIIRARDAISFIFKRGTAGWKIIHGHESWYQFPVCRQAGI